MVSTHILLDGFDLEKLMSGEEIVVSTEIPIGRTNMTVDYIRIRLSPNALSNVRVKYDVPDLTPHLIDVTCSWEIEKLCGRRLYVIGVGYSEDDLTDYEKELIEFTKEWHKTL